MARITVVNDYPDFLETMYAILDGMEGHEVAGFEGDATTVEQLIASTPTCSSSTCAPSATT